MPAQLCARGLCVMQSEWLYVGKLQHKEHHSKKSTIRTFGEEKKVETSKLHGKGSPMRLWEKKTAER